MGNTLEQNKGGILSEVAGSIAKHEIILHEYAHGWKRKITVDGKTYNSRIEMLDAFNLAESTVNRFKRKFDLAQEDAISMAIDYRIAQDEKMRLSRKNKEEQMLKEKKRREQKAKEKEFVFRDRINKSFESCCSYYNRKFGISLNSNSLKQSAKRNNETLQTVLEKALKRHLRQKFRNRIKYNKKYGVVVFNTKEKADRCAKMLNDRVEYRLLTAYDSEDWKKMEAVFM